MPLLSMDCNINLAPSSSVLFMMSKTSLVGINCHPGRAFPGVSPSSLSDPRKQCLISAVKNETPAHLGGWAALWFVLFCALFCVGLFSVWGYYGRRVAWIARRSNQSILKEINPEYSLEWLLLNLKLLYFGYLMASRLTGKDSDSGKDWRQNGKGWQRMRWLASIIDWMDMNLNKFQEIVEDRGILYATVNGVTKSQTWLSDWTITTILDVIPRLVKLQ